MGSYIESKGRGLHQAQGLHLMMMMIVIDLDLGPLPMRLSPIMRSVIIGKGIEARPIGAWEMIL